EPAGRARRGRVLHEQRGRQRRESLLEQHEQYPEEKRHPEGHRGQRHHEIEAVDEEPPPVTSRAGAHVLVPSPRARRAIRNRDAASTMSVSTNSTRPSAISDARCTGSAASLNSCGSAAALELRGSNNATT